MDYRILRDGKQLAKVYDWPNKFHSDGILTAAFAFKFTTWVSNFQPGDFRKYRWEAVPVETESGGKDDPQ